MRIVVVDVRVTPPLETALRFESDHEAVWREWKERVWPLLVPVEATRFEVALLDDDGSLLEVGGLDERGFTLLNESPPNRVENPVRWSP
jgi:hypothetical protein